MPSKIPLRIVCLGDAGNAFKAAPVGASKLRRAACAGDRPGCGLEFRRQLGKLADAAGWFYPQVNVDRKLWKTTILN